MRQYRIVGWIVVLSAGVVASTAVGPRGVVPGGLPASLVSAAADTLAERLFQARCFACHGNVAEYAPSRHALAALPVEVIGAALTTGSMREMAAGLTRAEIERLAEHLGSPGVAVGPAGEGARCAEPGPPFTLSDTDWNGWGRDLDNTRYQPDPGISAEEVPRLRVKWAFGYPGGGVVSQPTVAGGRVFAAGREVHALDARTGCTYWSYDPGPRGVRAAITIGRMPEGSAARYAAYAAGRNTTVHALDAETGELIWATRVGNHPVAQLTGAPVLHDGRLYVPVSSSEEGSAAAPGYECCTFRGYVVTLDAYTGEELWRGFTVLEEPRPFRINEDSAQMYGPAGAAIWSAPTLDPLGNALYVGTGNSYTEVDEGGSSGLLAFDTSTGAFHWRNQITEDDNYVVGCFGPSEGRGPPHANCPEELGPDWDFGASPILRTLPDGRTVLIAGQKSGVVYGVDPDDGSKLWQTRLGAGGPLGGVQWGMAADETRVYVPMSDVGHYNFRTEEPRPGLSAVDPATGEVVWHSPAPPPDCAWGNRDRPREAWLEPSSCNQAFSAPATVIPGVVFAGSVDGNLRAYSTRDGSILWTYNTGRGYATVNRVEARGGSLNATGPVVADGALFMNSGYAAYGGHAGNVLLAFTVDGR